MGIRADPRGIEMTVGVCACVCVCLCMCVCVSVCVFESVRLFVCAFV